HHLDQLLVGLRAKASERVVARAAGRFRERLSLRFGLRGAEVERAGARAALDDRAAEQTTAARRREVEAHAPRARRLSEDRDPARISSERSDVPLHPLERRALIEQPERR